MGGDDLGSDDEYLTGNVVDDQDDFLFLDKKKSVLEASTVAVMDDNDDDNATQKKQKKRSRTTNDDSSDHEDTNTTNNHEDAALTKKKKTTQSATPSSSRNKLLLEVGRTIQDQPAEKQASYLWTMLMHHHQLQSGQNDDNSTGDKEAVPLKPQLQACHFQTSTTSTTETTTMQARLRACIPSMKQLKTWNRKQSPMIIIVCLSARRAVQVLKDIASLKIRAVKLFAKHLSVEQQTSWLASGSSGIAVGTPHRLSVLCAKQALRLTHTRLIVLDAHQDAKQFTVCTLPDTAPHCMEWLRDHVLPVMEQRGPKELKLAFC